MTTGALPAGLTLASNGTLSGTPTAGGSFSFTVTASDSSTGAGPYTSSQTYTLAVNSAPPLVANDVATVLSGGSIDIGVTTNDTGTIDSIAIASVPAHGTAIVNGLVVSYASTAGYSGTDTFTYTATGPGGASAPATVTVTINPVPAAVSRNVDAIAGIEAVVDLTDGATGGPFTAANLIALSPANAGTTSIEIVGSGVSARYLLHFTPDGAFTGDASARFTLSNSYATSGVSTITFRVQSRPDPTQDAEVRGLVDAQVQSTLRFAQSQIDNFSSRLERLHGSGRRGGFDNSLSVSSRAQKCDAGGNLNESERGTCGQGDARRGASSDAEATEAGAHGIATSRPFGVWIAGSIRSGSFDGRGGSSVGVETDGVSVGADFDVSQNLSLGAGLGYARDDNDVGEHGSRLQGKAHSYVGYASYHTDTNLFVDGLLGYQNLTYDTRRFLNGVGGFVEGRRDGDQWFGSVAVGTDISHGETQYTPYARVDVSRGTLNGYTESGHPTLALAYDAMGVDSTIGNLGLRIDYREQTSWGWLTPQFRLEYQHEFAGSDDAILRYADLAGGPFYTLTPSSFDRNRLRLGLGLTFDSTRGWGLRLGYDGMFDGSGNDDHGLRINFEREL
ncbi:MAG: autotransporter domain-containing protein [Xanthomonadaceae bacterium]|nr:autotransporter domain-containing protein [Xanthomonadaceae bacterium]